MSTKTKDEFDDSNQIPSNWMKFNVPLEDKIFGTVVTKKQVKSTMPGREGELTWVYEMKASPASDGSSGQFHVLDEKKKVIDEPVLINDGDFYSIGGNATIDRQMQNIKVGQKIGLKFIEEKASKTKGFAPAKIVKVFAPKNDDGTFRMDDAWLLENEFNGV